MSYVEEAAGTGEVSVPVAITPRGPLSGRILELLASPNPVREFRPVLHLVQGAIDEAESVSRDEDIQLTLFLLYDLHYGSLGEMSDEWEWQPGLIDARIRIEHELERELRTAITPPALPRPTAADVARALTNLTRARRDSTFPTYIAKTATADQIGEYLIHRSVATLREADPYAWAVPRLTGRAKAALVEIQADENGDGRPSRMHSEMFARTLQALDLDPRYGHYIDNVPAVTLASLNMVSMFGLNRRLRGAVIGHLAAFELTTSTPNLLFGNGLRRLGHGRPATEYFDEHVAFEATHQRIVAHELAGALAEDHPALLPYIIFGACACLAAEGWVERHLLTSWEADTSSLRMRP
jgi:hypothetical protein